MVKELLGLPLLERFRSLDGKTRLAMLSLSQKDAEAADTVYQLRLCLRICRILKRFVRNSPDYPVASSVLDQCYRATGRVRDLQVGLILVQQLEQLWPCSHSSLSTTLALRLQRDFGALSSEVDALGLVAAMQNLDQAFFALVARVTEETLHLRAHKHAKKLEMRMQHRLHQALLAQREQDWHDLRLAIKRYRFWVSSLADWMPEPLLINVRRLKPLQGALGQFNDWVVLQTWLPTVADVPLERWLVEVERQKQQALVQARALLLPLQMLEPWGACPDD
jgi:CHAD domain-containing protein